MDFQRLLLVAALSFTLLMIWQAWQKDYGPQPPVVATTTAAPAENSAVPTASMPATPEAGSASDGPIAVDRSVMSSAKRISIKTDLVHAEIDTTGGDLRQVKLLDYPVDVAEPDVPFRLLDDGSETFHIAQAALLAAKGSGSTAPDHHAIFSAEQAEYTLVDGEDSLTIPLLWQNDAGITVIKRYTFHRGSYKIDVDFEVVNQGTAPWQGFMYHQLQRTRPDDSGSSNFIYTYTGGVLYTEEERYEKIDFDDMEDRDLKRKATGGWAAMIQHYFVTAWVPEQTEVNNYYSRSVGNERYIIGMVGSDTTVAPGQRGQMGASLFVGPKLQNTLADIAPGLELTVDYGILTVIAKPLFWLLDMIHSFVGNWGWAIIFLTMLIKLAFYKLSETSYKSMANMRKMQPKMQSIKEQYGDDRQKMNEAMMRLYKEEKINPLGGCLPILVQIPVFIALYWTLLESVEMRQAPFMLWINDLSSADPYFVLPILMGISMLIQHKLNPTPLDPVQARVMMVLPIVFTIFFLWFPAGLVLYWVVNNTLSIAQQWYITRIVVKA